MIEKLVSMDEVTPRPTNADWVASDQATSIDSIPSIEVRFAPRGTLVSASRVIKEALSFQPKTVVNSLVDPKIARSIGKQSLELKAMRENWDGEGATPLNPDRVDRLANDLLAVLRGYEGPYVDLVPGGDGSLQAEIRLPDGNDIFYGFDRNGVRYFFSSGPQGDWSSEGLAARSDLEHSLLEYRKASSGSGATSTA